MANRLLGFRFFAQSGCDDLRRHTRSTADHITPAIPAFVVAACDEARLRRGLDHLRSIHEHPHNASTQMVCRARGRA